MRAVTYARVSDDEKGKHGYSLGEQKRNLLEHCQRRGYVHVEHIEEGGISGKIADRPGIRRLVELMDRRVVDVIVMKRLNRLSRKSWRSKQVLEEWREAGFRIEFLDHVAGDTPDERLHVGILGELDEYYLEQIRLLTMATRAAKARLGKVPVNCKPFGYHCITKAEAAVVPEMFGRDGELLLVDAEAEIVREMFRKVAAGGSVMGVATWLNEAGIRTKRGNPWHQTVVRLLLQNPIYAGRFVYGKEIHRHTERETRGGKSQSRRTPRDPAEWIVIPCPAIVDEATWQRVQERLAATKDAWRGRPTQAWPLRGVVFCGQCHTRGGDPRRCTGWRSSNERQRPGYSYRQYVCGSKSNATLEYCGTHYPAGPLEALAQERLDRATALGELGRRARALYEQQRRTSENAEGELARLRRELEAVDQDERRIAGLILRGIADHIVDEMLGPVKVRRAGIEAQIQALTLRLGTTEDPGEAERIAEEVSARVRELRAAAATDPAILQRLFGLLLRVTLWPESEPDIVVRVGAALGLHGRL